MIKVLFICHGNICRSPMAEYYMKYCVARVGSTERFLIASAATHTDEIWNGKGNPVYPPVAKLLAAHGISCKGKTARLLTSKDYSQFDHIVGMDSENMICMRRIFGGDSEGKLSLLMDHTDRPGEVSDPWYTRDFEATWRDVTCGCEGLLEYLLQEHHPV